MVKKILVVDARRALTRGNSICADKRALLIMGTQCPWPKELCFLSRLYLVSESCCSRFSASQKLNKHLPSARS